MLPEGLIRFLKTPESYPHHPEEVEHIQTHISHVFIAPPFVYKFKKPLNLDFLDFSTLEKRKHYCKREVELNRRLCEGLYLGVIRTVQLKDNYILEYDGDDDEAEIVEYAVKMKQLKRENFLIASVKEGKFKVESLEKVRDTLVPFYKDQTPSGEILKYGKPGKIMVNTDENFEQTRDYVGKTIDQVSYHAIQHFTNEYLKRGEVLFEKRVDQKRIVDGHGDLHLEHINITDDRVCIYDCIEFNNRFRFQDIAADLAFLAMDLDFYGLHNAGQTFIAGMAEELNDPDMERMVEFYKCYRAYVRGKVKSMESSEEDVPEPKRKRAEKKAARYFALSLYYALFGSSPVILIMMGRVASGKSTVASGLAELTGVQHYSTDVIRKKLAGTDLTERLPEKERNQLYSTHMSEKTYDRLLEKALMETKKGRSVVLDGTFGNSKARKEWVSYLESKGIRFHFVEAVVPDTYRRQRLQARSNRDDSISDARLEDMEMLDRKYEDPLDDEILPLIRIRTDLPLMETRVELCEKLSELHLSEELFL